jgi:hypothetical protein
MCDWGCTDTPTPDMLIVSHVSMRCWEMVTHRSILGMMGRHIALALARFVSSHPDKSNIRADEILAQANFRRSSVATKLKVTYVKDSFLDVGHLYSSFLSLASDFLAVGQGSVQRV